MTEKKKVGRKPAPHKFVVVRIDEPLYHFLIDMKIKTKKSSIAKVIHYLLQKNS